MAKERVSRQTAGKARPLVQAGAGGMSAPGGGGHPAPVPLKTGPSPGGGSFWAWLFSAISSEYMTATIGRVDQHRRSAGSD
jgi:hypothetical protein